MRPVFYNRINQRYKHSNYGLAPNFRFDAGVVTISDDLPNRILLGTINIKCNVKEFTEDGAIFEDGSKLENINVVIMATGFNFSFPFLDQSIIKVEGHYPYLYELIFPTDLNPCTLGVVGLVQPFGALPPVLEMQARLVCRVFAGKVNIPSSAQRLEVVEKRRAFIKEKYVDSPRYSLQIYFIQYLDKLASMIGCKPDLKKYFFTDPKLWSKIYFGAATPPQWRLNGPGAWKGAREAIENVEENTYFPMKSRQAGLKEKEGLYDGWIKLFKNIVFYILLMMFIHYVVSNGYISKFMKI